MNFIILLLGVCIIGCQTTKYHEPVNLTQQEIMNMNLVDRRTSVNTHMQAGKITYCRFGKSDKNCALLICKVNKSQTSGFDCQMFEPVNEDEAGTEPQYKNDFVQKMVEAKVADFNEGREKSLIDFCKKNNVVCYFDRKYYPADKEISPKAFVRTVYKNSYKIKENHVIEISVNEVK